jgi:hypothetical protein
MHLNQTAGRSFFGGFHTPARGAHAINPFIIIIFFEPQLADALSFSCRHLYLRKFQSKRIAEGAECCLLYLRKRDGTTGEFPTHGGHSLAEAGDSTVKCLWNREIQNIQHGLKVKIDEETRVEEGDAVLVL